MELGSEALTAASQCDFAFVYIPYATPGFMGGIVDGHTGELRDKARVGVRA